MGTKGLCELLDGIGRGDKTVKRVDWTMSLPDLEFALNGEGFFTSAGQLEIELDRANQTNPDFPYTVTREGDRYRFAVKDRT